MSETHDSETGVSAFGRVPECVPPNERLYHERLDGDDPAVATHLEDAKSNSL